MATTIGASIKLGGAEDFKKSISQSNQLMRSMQSELKQLQTEFSVCENKVENYAAQQKALKSIQEEQRERVKALREQLSAAAETYGETSQQVEKYARQLQQEEQALKLTDVQIQQLNGSMKELAQTEIGKIGDELNKWGAGIAAVAATAVGAGTALFTMAANAGLAADDINTLNKTTGLTTKQLQELAYASDLIDVSTETLTGAMTKMQNNMQSARDGTTSLQKTFEALNVQYTNTDGTLRDTTETFDDIITALGKVENETERDAYAMDIFGKSAKQLNPLILGGADALKELSAEANNMGLILGQTDLDHLNAFNDKIDTAKAQIEALKNKVAVEFVDAFTPVFDVFDDLRDRLLVAIEDGTVKKVAQDVGKTIAEIVEALLKLIEIVVKYKEVIAAVTVGVIAFNAAMSAYKIWQSATVALQALKAATESQTIAQLALNTAMDANPIGLIVAGVVALAAALGVLISTIDNIGSKEVENSRKSTEEYEKQRDKVDKLTQSYDNNKKKIEELNTLRNDGTITERQEREISNLEAQNELLQSQIEAEQALLQIKQEQADKDAQNVLNGASTDVGSIERAQQMVSDYNTALTEMHENQVYFDNLIIEEQNRLVNEKDKLSDKEIRQIEDNIAMYETQKQAIEQTEKNLTETFAEEAEEQLTAMQDASNGLSGLSAESQQTMSDAAAAMSVISDALGTTRDEIVESVNAINYYIDYGNQSAIESQKQYAKQRQEEADKQVTQAENNAKKIENSWKRIDEEYAIGAIATEEEAWQRKQKVFEKYGNATETQYRQYYISLLSHQKTADENAAKQAETAAKAAKSEAEKRQKEELTAAKKAYDELLRTYENHTIDKIEYERQYTALLEQYKNVQVDLEKYANEKITEYDKKQQEEKQKTAKDTITSIYNDYTKAMSDIDNKIQSYADKIGKNFTDLMDIEKDENGKITSISNGNGITDENKQLEAYLSQLQKLKQKGVSQNLLTQLTDMDLATAYATAKYWNSLSETQLQNLSDNWQKNADIRQQIAEEMYADEAKNTAQTYCDKIIEAINELEPELQKYAMNIVQSLFTGVDTSGDEGLESVEDLKSILIDYMGLATEETAEDAKKNGAKIGTAMTKGVTEKIQSDSEAYRKALQQTIDTATAEIGTIEIPVKFAYEQTQFDINANNANTANGANNNTNSGRAGNTTFIQNNYSPKSLDASSIRDNTQSQLALSAIH